MATFEQVRQIVGEVLQLESRIDRFDSSTQLLGSIPEFDSMAVVSVLTALEEYFGIMVDDDEVSAELFETLGSLHAFVVEKMAG